MYKKQRKTLKSFLNGIYGEETFSRNTVNIIIRALLEPVANTNTPSLIFTRLKSKEGLEGLIKRLEYCTNVEMTDTLKNGLLIKDDYVELEFIIFTSARYNFAAIFDYSDDFEKNRTKFFFLANSRNVNDVFEILQNNMNKDYREKFYLHKPERRENELLNEAIFNVMKKLNTSIEENSYKSNDDFIIDLVEENDTDEKIREVSHEIKNQLSVLDVYTTLIERTFGKNKNIDVIKKACANISLTLHELKNMENIEIKEVSVRDVIEEAKQIFEEVFKINGNKIEFIDHTGYEATVFADENKLLSCINNILKNSNESTSNDTIVIELKEKENFLNIEITNHGTKISKEAMERIFDKGFTTKQKGSGVGLYASKNHIEKFGGALVLETSTNEKTVFKITLPLNQT